MTVSTNLLQSLFKPMTDEYYILILGEYHLNSWPNVSKCFHVTVISIDIELYFQSCDTVPLHLNKLWSVENEFHHILLNLINNQIQLPKPKWTFSPLWLTSEAQCWLCYCGYCSYLPLCSGCDQITAANLIAIGLSDGALTVTQTHALYLYWL